MRPTFPHSRIPHSHTPAFHHVPPHRRPKRKLPRLAEKCRRHKTAYYRQTIHGRERKKSLGELAPDDARALARKLRQAAALDDIERRLRYAREAARPAVTFAALFATYDTYAVGANLDRCTVVKNKNSLALILRHTLDRAALESAQRTIRSTVRQARSLFSRGAMQSRAYAALRLDDLPGLPAALKVSLGESSTKPYEPLPDGILEHIGREAAALKAANPALWLAFQLEINAGLRRGSVVFARWDWFVDRGADIDGGRWIDLGIRVAKGRNYTVRIDPAWHDELLAVRAAGGGGADYILPGETEAERDAVCAALVPWLRERGFADRRQPNHELRKLYGNAKYSLHGPAEGQRALGHSTPVLTSTVYSAARTLKALRVV